MRLLVTADLHFEVARSKGPAMQTAERISGSDADALIVAGDTSAFDPAALTEALRHFDGFRGRKFVVAGNHDLWVWGGGVGGRDSAAHYAALEAASEAAGFRMLDHAPAVVDGVGFVGNVGWFDLSFAHADLGIPRRFYEAKVAPGAAAIIEEYRGLLSPEAGEPPGERGMGVRARWMDGWRVKWPWSDAEFLDRCLERLDRDLTAVAREADRIVAVVHHLPFAELVHRSPDDRFAFAAAYFGSPRIGELLLRHPKVRLAFCGHSHREGRVEKGALTCINVGSTYEAKRVVEAEI
jgi:3',5'-cyclic AMP phosphodiesterase CpdA